MDYFTKNKVLFWCVIVLILLNMASLGSFWIKKRPHGPPPMPGGQKVMEERLDLSDQQVQQFEQIRDDHFSQTIPLQEEMHKLRLELLEEIFVTTPEEAKIQEILKKLEQRSGQFEVSLLQHFQQLKNVCDQKQTEALKLMLADIIERGRPRDPRRHLPRPSGDFRYESGGDFGPHPGPPHR
ncbi:MAG: periplasmic heavy metal sensor [Phycisphaerae bacterium]|nr:periplasmic heavy metal sensor [Phycisphaerae bacterium]